MGLSPCLLTNFFVWSVRYSKISDHQTILIEAAKLARHWKPQLAAVHERELQKGNRNWTTLAVARRLVANMMEIDKNQIEFILRGEEKSGLRERTYSLLK